MKKPAISKVPFLKDKPAVVKASVGDHYWVAAFDAKGNGWRVTGPTAKSAAEAIVAWNKAWKK